MSTSHATTSIARKKKSPSKAARGGRAPAVGCAPAVGREARQAVADMLEILKSGGDSRHRKVRRLRAAIKVRAYENDLKFQIAIDRMMRHFTEDL
jgi:hypothetical protein